MTKHVCAGGSPGGPRFQPLVLATGPGAQGCACEGLCPHVRECVRAGLWAWGDGVCLRICVQEGVHPEPCVCVETEIYQQGLYGCTSVIVCADNLNTGQPEPEPPTPSPVY